jgi:hypothetical protein
VVHHQAASGKATPKQAASGQPAPGTGSGVVKNLVDSLPSVGEFFSSATSFLGGGGKALARPAASAHNRVKETAQNPNRVSLSTNFRNKSG